MTYSAERLAYRLLLGAGWSNGAETLSVSAWDVECLTGRQFHESPGPYRCLDPHEPFQFVYVGTPDGVLAEVAYRNRRGVVTDQNAGAALRRVLPYTARKLRRWARNPVNRVVWLASGPDALAVDLRRLATFLHQFSPADGAFEDWEIAPGRPVRWTRWYIDGRPCIEARVGKTGEPTIIDQTDLEAFGWPKALPAADPRTGAWV